jgi:2'-hydroxyisoflavone reductase
MVDQAIARGHAVTIFTRGKSAAALPLAVERLIGDRDGHLEALRNRSWDVVIDNSGYIPEQVQASAELLKNSVGHYVFTSATDAYRDYYARNIDESYPRATLPAGIAHDRDRYYGPLKALCEEHVARIYPNQHTIIRCGWIVGHGNYRLDYWVMRIRRGKEMLAPGTPDDPIQFIDVRDLAQWYISMAESQRGGPYNAVGPSMTWGQVFHVIQSVTRTTPTLTWVNADYLKANKVMPYFDLPMWWPPRNDYHIDSMPAGLDGGVGAFTINESKAQAAGLRHQPLPEIVTDTLHWYVSEYSDWQDGKHGGLTFAREQELLAAWKAESKT